jgi:hypothetical protein
LKVSVGVEQAPATKSSFQSLRTRPLGRLPQKLLRVSLDELLILVFRFELARSDRHRASPGLLADVVVGHENKPADGDLIIGQIEFLLQF